MTTIAQPLIKNYIDKELLQEVAAASTLWVIVSEKRMMLMVADKTNNRIVGLTVIEFTDSLFQKGLFELKSILAELTLSQMEYHATHIVFETPQFTIIPQALFIPEKAQSYLTVLHEIPKFFGALSDRIESQSSVAVYAVPEIFCSTLKAIYPMAEIHHYAPIVIDTISKMNAKHNSTLYVNIHSQYMDVLLMHHTDLKYVNTFQTEAETDVIYFILSVAEQQKIAVEKASLVLMGDFNVNGTLLPLLKKYIPNVTIYKKSELVSYPASFREFQDQYYFTVSSIIQCA